MAEKMFVLAAFTLRPRCPKCESERFRWEFRRFAGQGGPTEALGDSIRMAPCEHLHLTCDRCGFGFDMMAKDGAK